MAELSGKGWRVLGYFLWMLGSGVVLDGDPGLAARVLLVVGAGLFGLGVWQASFGRAGA